MRRMTIIAAAAMLIGAADEKPTLPGWMAGCWEQVEGDGWTEECWTAPRAGIMLGSARSEAGGKLAFWEAMQIMIDAPASDGPVVRMAFFAAPRGVDRTMFAWRPETGGGVTFINMANDYPQRIRYRPEGDMLVAEIAMADGSRPQRWRYRRK